ncbi:UrcA family protein [Sphingomonas sp. HDW15A]|uniref:UrcA family protein n=1 Tax=Sphingomonas sp. HDW15A TaxID=2714942 RepID=UPI00140A6984|nr:UrcA family protein [Sphingomonas sp. HDW15A]QIK95614.1 UrcA family protein [Sphingomonas sp. HDW15A]
MTKFTIFALAALSSGLLISPSVAAESSVRIIEVADLDLASPTGQHQFQTRATRAAIELCGEASNVDLSGRNDVRQCRDDVIAQANQQREVRLASRSAGPIRVAAR